MPVVTLPEGEELEFPDGMAEQDMRAAIEKHFPKYGRKAPAAPAPESPAPTARAPTGSALDGPSFADLSAAPAPAPLTALAPGAAAPAAAIKPPPTPATPAVTPMGRSLGISFSRAPAVDHEAVLDRPGRAPTAADTAARANWDSLSPQGQEKAMAEMRYQTGRRTAPSVTNSPEPGIVQRALDTTVRKPLDNSLLGSAVETAGDAARGVFKASNNLAQSAWGGVQAAADAVGAEGVGDLAGASVKAGERRAASLTNARDPNGLVSQVFESTFTSVPLALGAPGAPLRALMAQSAAQEYGQSRARGLDGNASAERAVWMGLAEGIGERFGMPQLQKLFTRAAQQATSKELGHILADMLVKEQLGEQVTTALQSGYEAMGTYGRRPGMSLAEYLNDAAETAKVTLGQSLLTGGLAGGVKKLAQQQGRASDLAGALDADIHESPDEALARAIDASPFGIARQAGFHVDPPLRTDSPVTVRKKVEDVFRNAASTVGMAPAAVEAAVKAAQSRGIGDLGAYFSRFTQSARARGLSAADLDPVIGEALSTGPLDVTPQLKPIPPEAFKLLDDGTGLAADEPVQAQGGQPSEGPGAPQATPAPAPSAEDDMLAQAEEIVRQTGRGSISAVQRHLRIGYNRAARLMEQLEAKGVVGPVDAQGARELLKAAPTLVDERAHAAATSPTNGLAEPTQAQKEAGNYAKGHVRVAGLDLAIENPEGSVRRGVDRDGKAWENRLASHYGYIKGTVGNDKDHVDAFVKPGTQPDYSGPVFVVDQVHPDTGRFDEHKVILGAADEAEAERMYRANYADDWQGLAAITRLPMPAFKSWVRDGSKKQPLGDINARMPVPAAAGPAGGDRAGAADAGGGLAAAGRLDSVSDFAVPAGMEAAAGSAGPAGAGPRGDDAALTPRFKSTTKKDGTLLVYGKPADIKQALPRFKGITGNRGITFGKRDAKAVLAALETINAPKQAQPPQAEASGTPPADAGPAAGSTPGEGATAVPSAGPAPAQAARVSKQKKRPKLDPENDTLLQAAAKMGGIDRDELAREFGLKPEELKSTVKVGNLKGFPFRKAGGMSIDAAAEQLREAGYFDGVADDEIRLTLETAIFDELGGRPRRSTVGQMRSAEERAAEAQEQAEELTPDEARELDALLPPAAEASLEDEDIPFLDGEFKNDGRALAQFLGETYDADLHGPEAQEPAANPATADAGQDRSNAAREAAAPAGAAGQEARDLPAAEGLTLASPTRVDLQSQADRAKRAKATDDAEQKRLADKAKADAQRDEFTLTGSDSPADVAAAAGQGGLFDAPAQPPAPTVSPGPQRAKSTKVEAGDSPEVAQAKADALRALGDLADILGQASRKNMLPEQEQRLMPVLTRLMDAAFRLGYLKFKEAAKFALDQIRAAIGDEAADAITLDHLQGAYIGMAGRYKDQGAERPAAVAAVESMAEIESADTSAEEPNDVPNAIADLERDRSDAAAGVATVAPDDVAGARGDGLGDQGPGSTVGAEGGRPAFDPGVPADGAAAGRERGDQPVRRGEGQSGPAGFPAGADVDQRGAAARKPRVPAEPIPASQVAQAAAGGLRDGDKRRAQRLADSVPVKPGDLANIRETLPYLLPEQQEDVHKAETRFAVPDGYGMLFTNGTGTGKTFTGLGVVKRFERQGKTDILVVVPDGKIMADWVDSGRALGLDITALENTGDAGRGITITTYANLGANDALAGRRWDLIVTDEAHSLMQSADGDESLALQALRAISMHPRGAQTRLNMLHRDDIDALAQVSKQIDANNTIMSGDDAADAVRASIKAENAKLEVQRKALNVKLEAARQAVGADIEANQLERRTRVTFLSATPFAYEKTIDWAEGYLFDYGEGQTGQNLASGSGAGHGYNSGNWRDKFFMQHFGYRMRYNKLTQPDAKVDSGLMQRQFNSWLKKRGALSGRQLDVAADYDRKFVLVDSAVGNEIDRAIEWIGDKDKATREALKDKKDEGVNGFELLAAELRERLYSKQGHLVRRYLLEAIKAKEVIQQVRDHMALGRKVVVFHDFKKGGANNPFDFPPVHASQIDDEDSAKRAAKAQAYNAAAAAFRAEFPSLTGDQLLSDLISPIQRFTQEFPGVLLINGNEKPADLLNRYKAFQSDETGPVVALVQSAKNKGWSGHDTTGKHQRVLFNLGLPTQPTMSIQQEGRIYRTGQVSNAMFRYLNTGTNWERWAFAQTIAERASAAENLGSGELARALKDAFISGFEESGDYPAGHDGEGTGGKARDRAANTAITAYDRARSFYFGTQKKTAKTKAQEGADYFATPEPVGFKMVEWADLRGGEDALEPSGGHGAIARWFPENVNRTAVEPSSALGSRMAMVFDGKIIRGQFEDLHVTNKFDAVVMNPPFGTAGRTAIDHVAKAATHLREGGRIVALIPTGPAADKKFDAWFYEEKTKPVKPAITHPTLGPIYVGDTIKSRASWAPEGRVASGTAQGDGVMVKVAGKTGTSLVTVQSITAAEPTGARTVSFRPAEGLHLVADIKLPQVTFERAGTAVATRIVVIDKLSKDQPAPGQVSRDYSSIDDINELFSRIEDATVPTRTKPVVEEAVEPERPATARSAAKAEQQAAAERGAKIAADAGQQIVEHVTGKGKTLRGVVRKGLSQDQAKQADEYTFKKDGGWFIREKHIERLNELFPEPKLSLAEEGATNDSTPAPAATEPEAVRVAARVQGFVDRATGRAGEHRVVPVDGTDAGAELRSARALARGVFGYQVQFVRLSNGPLFHGLMMPGQDGGKATIVIDVGTPKPVMAVLGHELLHILRTTNPAIYSDLQARLDQVMKSNAPYAQQLNTRRAKRGLPPLSADVLAEERIADVVGDQFTEPGFWRDLARANTSGFRRIADAVLSFIDDVIAKLTKRRPFGSDAYVKDLRAARAAVVDAMSAFAKAQAASGTGDARMSFRDGAAVALDENGNPEFENDRVRVAFPLPTERIEVIPQDGERVLSYAIMPATGFDVLGKVDLLVRDGAPVSLLDIEVEKGARNSGTARAAVEAILAGTDGDLNISNIVTESRGFWDKLGVPEQNLPDGHAYDGILNAETYRPGSRNDASAVREGARGPAGEGAAGDARADRQADAGTEDGARSSDGEGQGDEGVRLSLANKTPEQRVALARAGIGPGPTIKTRIALAFGRVVDVLRSRAELTDAFRQGALDQFHGIKRAVERDLGALGVDQDPYVAARLANGGTSSVMRGLLLHGQAAWGPNGQHLVKIPGTKGLLDILEPLGDDVADFFGWMVGNRAARLMKEGRENNFTAAQIAELQGLAGTRRAEFVKIAAEYSAFKRSVLDVAEGAGLINPAGRKVWDHADYIPFYRQIDEKATFSPTGRKGLAGQSSGVRTLRGGTAALNDPVENLLMNFSRLIDASLKNKAIAGTIDKLEAGGSFAVERVGYDMVGAVVPTSQVKRLLIEAGTPQPVLDAVPAEAFEGMAKLWAIQAPSDPDVVRVMRDGKPVFYKVHDPLLLRSLTSFVPFDFPGLGAARAFKRLLTATVTATPDFMLRNFVRDSAAAQAITRDGFNPVKSLTGIGKSYAESAGSEAMLFAGASFQSGNINAADPEGTAVAVRRALRSRGLDASTINGFMATMLDTPAKFWDRYRRVGEAIENANREAVFEAAQVKGGTTAAAFEAKDLMDFNLRGGWAAYQLLADVLPFFNARVQGLYRMGRSDPKRLVAVGLLMTVASAMLAFANDGEDWYEELPDWDKDTYWHFRIGSHHFRLPKPFELGVLFATIPERLGRSIKGLDTGKKTLSRTWANVRDQLAFDLVPQMFRPALNVAMNHDSFRDAPIENIGDEGKLPSSRYNARTSDTMRVLAQAASPVADATGMSPKRMEYLVGGYLGTVGTYALGFSDMVVRELEGKPPGPTLRADDLPVVKSFYRVDPARSTVFESDLYKLREEAQQVAKTLRAHAKAGDLARVAELKRGKMDLLRVEPVVTSAAQALSSMTKARDAIVADPKLTPAEKRAKIDALQVQRNELAKKVMTAPPVRATQ